MKHLKIAAMCIATAVVISATIANKCEASKTISPQHVKDSSFAVLELFTSEGCSSCPPADDLLASIQNQAGDKPIYLLSYHVDYWNRLGWKDIFSDAKFSDRQYAYSRRFAGQVYTPQLVVNGKSECVGSNQSSVNDAIENALKDHASTFLKVSGQQQPGRLDIEYEVTGKADNSELVIAVVQKHALSKVKRGENEGRTLSHAQIVRGFYNFHLKQLKGTERINLPEAFNTSDWEVLALVQQEQTGLIMAANRVLITPLSAMKKL